MPQAVPGTSRRAPLRLQMQTNRGGNRDKIFPKGRASIERAKKLDEANSGDQPSLIMREKSFTWPFPFGFLNTLKQDNPTVYKAFQLAWSVANTIVLHAFERVCERCTARAQEPCAWRKTENKTSIRRLVTG